MSTKIYAAGGSIVIESATSTQSIPLGGFFYRISGDQLKVCTEDYRVIASHQTSELINQQGAAIGNAANLKTYLQGFASSTPSSSGTPTSVSHQIIDYTDPSAQVIPPGYLTVSIHVDAENGAITINDGTNNTTWPHPNQNGSKLQTMDLGNGVSPSTTPITITGTGTVRVTITR